MHQSHLAGLAIIIGCAIAGLFYYQHEQGKLRHEHGTFVCKVTMRKATAMVRDRKHQMNILKAKHGEVYESQTVVNGKVVQIRGSTSHLRGMERALHEAEQIQRDAVHNANMDDTKLRSDKLAGEQGNALLGLTMHARTDAQGGVLNGEHLVRCQMIYNTKEQAQDNSRLLKKQTEARNATQYHVSKTVNSLLDGQTKYNNTMSKAAYLHAANNNGYAMELI